MERIGQRLGSSHWRAGWFFVQHIGRDCMEGRVPRRECHSVGQSDQHGERCGSQGSWAQWPVGDMGQTVPYYFTNNKFTLSATVTIHEVPKEDSSPIPLMGARLNDKDNTVLFQLSYTSEGNWNFTL
ncbi:putative trans-sialidase, partial [Trypanosoma cruzi]